MDRKILIVDETDEERLLLARQIQQMGFRTAVASNAQQAMEYLKAHVDGVFMFLLDLAMPIEEGLETLDVLVQKSPDIPIIVLSEREDTESAVEAMKRGAFDFINKPVDLEKLQLRIENVVKIQYEIEPKESVEETKVTLSGALDFKTLYEISPDLKDILKSGQQAAKTEVPVLITGENGVGKETFAKAIHLESFRKNETFLSVDCSALSEHLADSILFGHRKEAFPGATAHQAGKFREADGGTIFLKEITHLSKETQQSLLKVMEEQSVTPLGSGRAVPVNVHIIASTQKNILRMVNEGEFLEALYFRLNVVKIDVPPLRKRRQDIMSLAHHNILLHCEKFGRDEPEISKAAENFLINYPWPGNIGELKNMLKRALILNDTDMLYADDFLAELNELKTFETLKPSSDPISVKQGFSFLNEDGSLKTMDQIEHEAAAFALNHCDHNATQAAKALGIAKSTFYRKIVYEKKA